MIPELPEDVQYIDVSGCTSLQKLPDDMSNILYLNCQYTPLLKWGKIMTQNAYLPLHISTLKKQLSFKKITRTLIQKGRKAKHNLIVRKYITFLTYASNHGGKDVCGKIIAWLG